MKAVGCVLAVWGIELVLFALVVAALLAERPLALGTTIAAIAALAIVARTSARLWEGATAAFRAHRAAALAGAGGLALALPFFLRANPYWTFVATLALAYVTIGQGLNLQIGTTGVINLAGAAFAGLGGYAVGLLTVRLGLVPWLAFLVGPLVAVIVGALLFIPILKVRRHPDPPAVRVRLHDRAGPPRDEAPLPRQLLLPGPRHGGPGHLARLAPLQLLGRAHPPRSRGPCPAGSRRCWPSAAG